MATTFSCSASIESDANVMFTGVLITSDYIPNGHRMLVKLSRNGATENLYIGGVDPAGGVITLYKYVYCTAGEYTWEASPEVYLNGAWQPLPYSDSGSFTITRGYAKVNRCYINLNPNGGTFLRHAEYPSLTESFFEQYVPDGDDDVSDVLFSTAPISPPLPEYIFSGWGLANEFGTFYTRVDGRRMPLKFRDGETYEAVAVFKRPATAYVNIGGVWQRAYPQINIDGEWKPYTPYI